jgi:hypothetical protein
MTGFQIEDGTQNRRTKFGISVIVKLVVIKGGTLHSGIRDLLLAFPYMYVYGGDE